MACPGSGYTKKTVYYQNFTDTRDCSTCACGAANGGSCGNATVTLYTNDTCSVGSTTLSGPSVCVDLPADADPLASPNCAGDSGDTRSAKLAATATGASCTPTGGQVMGAVTPASPTTFCCL